MEEKKMDEATTRNLLAVLYAYMNMRFERTMK